MTRRVSFVFITLVVLFSSHELAQATFVGLVEPECFDIEENAACQGVPSDPVRGYELCRSFKIKAEQCKGTIPCDESGCPPDCSELAIWLWEFLYEYGRVNCSKSCGFCTDCESIRATHRYDEYPDLYAAVDSLKWQCSSGECIHQNHGNPGDMEWRCDGIAHCADGTDESFDTCGICTGNGFVRGACPPGLGLNCLPWEYKCNGISDCPDGSDELDCTCAAGNKWQCETGGQCIPIEQRCDDTVHCRDHSDECGCDSPVMRCKNGQHNPPEEVCYYDIYFCDNIVSCPDESDENFCSCDPAVEFECNNGACLESTTWECDGEIDCLDASDEDHCGPCDPTTEFECVTSGACLAISAECDREKDCPDWSDENNCVCSATEFKCNSGACLPSTWECDGKIDCLDASDEHSGCNANRAAESEPRAIGKKAKLVAKGDSYFFEKGPVKEYRAKRAYTTTKRRKGRQN